MSMTKKQLRLNANTVMQKEGVEEFFKREGGQDDGGRFESFYNAFCFYRRAENDGASMMMSRSVFQMCPNNY